jgi:WD40 repeat protein
MEHFVYGTSKPGIKMDASDPESSRGLRRVCTTHIWDVKTGEVLYRPFITEGHYATSTAFSPDGKRIVSGYEDDKICKGVRSVEGTQFVSVADDNTARVWDISNPSTTDNKIHAGFSDASRLEYDGWMRDSASLRGPTSIQTKPFAPQECSGMYIACKRRS